MNIKDIATAVDTIGLVKLISLLSKCREPYVHVDKLQLKSFIFLKHALSQTASATHASPTRAHVDKNLEWSCTPITDYT